MPNSKKNQTVRIFKHEEETIRLGGTEADKPVVLGGTNPISEKGVFVSRELGGIKAETLGMNESETEVFAESQHQNTQQRTFTKINGGKRTLLHLSRRRNLYCALGQPRNTLSNRLTKFRYRKLIPLFGAKTGT